MGITLAGLAIAGKVAAGAAAVGGAYSASETARFAKRSAKKGEEATQKLIAEEEKQRKQTAFSILKRRKSGERPTRDTVLTSPLGVTGETGQSGKRLLGL